LGRKLIENWLIEIGAKAYCSLPALDVKRGQIGLDTFKLGRVGLVIELAT